MKTLLLLTILTAFSCTKQMDEGILQNNPVEFEQYYDAAYGWTLVNISGWTSGSCSYTLKTYSGTIHTGMISREAHKYEFSATCSNGYAYEKTWKRFDDFKKVVFPDEVIEAFPDLPLDVGEWELVYG